jgi:hypothetical protein
MSEEDSLIFLDIKIYKDLVVRVDYYSFAFINYDLFVSII